MLDQAVAVGGDKAHERLIDHFKRVYSIVAGLALTEACRHTLPIEDLADPRLWMFLTFFFTLVPIFHGGDRSLDEKYFGKPPQTVPQRLAFIWDDYMLLFTAILFICIAESIPTKSASVSPREFYIWLTGMFGFDAFVLIVDFAKSHDRNRLRPYKAWIPLNILLAAVCYVAASLIVTASPRSISVLSIIVFAVAVIRTILDYIAGERFLFPKDVAPG